MQTYISQKRSSNRSVGWHFSWLMGLDTFKNTSFIQCLASCLVEKCKSTFTGAPNWKSPTRLWLLNLRPSAPSWRRVCCCCWLKMLGVHATHYKNTSVKLSVTDHHHCAFMALWLVQRYLNLPISDVATPASIWCRLVRNYTAKNEFTSILIKI